VKQISRVAMMVLCAGLLVLPAAAQTSDTQGKGNSGPGQTDATNPMTKDSANQASSNKSSLTATDKRFVDKAAEGGKAEVELGQLAVQKAASDDVKKFGQRMVDDHTRANQKLQEVAQQKGITLPDKLDAKDQATKARLGKLSGKQFDQAYMKDMVKDHTKDVNEFQREANSAKDPDVKSFAQTTLPTLQDHLKEAKQIETSGKMTPSNRSK
jgi:putative membrane protein